MKRHVAAEGGGAGVSMAGGPLERFLSTELRLPLSTLARLGARLASRGEGELASVGRALARESARLDVLVTNALELGLVTDPPGPAGELLFAEVVEKAVAGQRFWIESLGVRVRVLDSSREATVRGDRDALLRCLFALLADLLERTPAAATIDLRVREVHGLVRLDVVAPRTAPAQEADRPAWAALRERVAGLGGELWPAATADDGGFGFALPRARGEVPLAVRRARRGEKALR